MRREGVVKQSADFFSPDGAVYAKNSRIDSIMELPFFKMTLDNNLQYSVHYKKSIRELMSVMSPREQQFYDKMRSFKITDGKARPLTKLCNMVYSQAAEMTFPDKKWSHKEVGLVLRDAIAQAACQAN
jgi:hypothetical protein